MSTGLPRAYFLTLRNPFHKEAPHSGVCFKFPAVEGCEEILPLSNEKAEGNE